MDFSLGQQVYCKNHSLWDHTGLEQIAEPHKVMLSSIVKLWAWALGVRSLISTIHKIKWIIDLLFYIYSTSSNYEITTSALGNKTNGFWEGFNLSKAFQAVRTWTLDSLIPKSICLTRMSHCLIIPDLVQLRSQAEIMYVQHLAQSLGHATYSNGRSYFYSLFYLRFLSVFNTKLFNGE